MVEDRSHPAPDPRRPAVLLYGMYQLRRLDRAPEVRISLISAALARQAQLETIVGGRVGRARCALRWLLAGRWRSIDGVYVELPSSAAMPTDLAFLALLRLLGRPVGIYFRDAYQLHRDLFPLHGTRQRVMDAYWRTTLPLVRRIASRRFSPSAGLAAELGLRDAVLLPPGTDPSLPNLGIGEPGLVAAIVSVAPRTGFDRLLEAVRRVREARPDVRLRVVAGHCDPDLLAGLPAWVEVVTAGRSGLGAALGPARVCVIPLPVTAYTDLAVPVRLMDLFGFGKPIVSTGSRESRCILEETGAGIVVDDNVEGLRDGIARILDDEALATGLAQRARAVAELPSWTWDARAATILDGIVDRSRRAAPDRHPAGVP